MSRTLTLSSESRVGLDPPCVSRRGVTAYPINLCPVYGRDPSVSNQYDRPRREYEQCHLPQACAVGRKRQTDRKP